MEINQWKFKLKTKLKKKLDKINSSNGQHSTDIQDKERKNSSTWIIIEVKMTRTYAQYKHTRKNGSSKRNLLTQVCLALPCLACECLCFWEAFKLGSNSWRSTTRETKLAICMKDGKRRKIDLCMLKLPTGRHFPAINTESTNCTILILIIMILITL